MRDRNTLPFLGERMNNYKKSSLRSKTLDSIPENDVASTQTKNLPSFCGNKYMSQYNKEESRHDRAERGYNNLPRGISLPKLKNRPTTISDFDRETCSPNSSSILSIANIPLSPRANTEKPKREAGINCANYLIYEPSVAGQVTANTDLSRYVFRSALERIPETDGERLLSARSTSKSHSVDDEKKDLTMTEKNISKKKKKEARAGNVKNVDLFNQQRQQLARKGPPTRVLLSCKLKENRPGTPNSFTKSQETNATLLFPRLVLYQWEVHEQSKIIKTFRSRKLPKKLPALHRIPTDSQRIQPIDKAGDGNGDDNDDDNDENIRVESPLSKIPHPPPPTPHCPLSSSEYATE